MKRHQLRVLTSQHWLDCSSHAFGVLLAISLCFSPVEYVHGATSITQTTGGGDLGTQVLPPIGHVYGITGGTPVGTNLYHSFAQFNVGEGDIAQFQTLTLSQDPAMQNILGRITDQNPSTIFGTIDSATYYPTANLFLMNPYGFLFGPNAMVNVGGMVAFTTADYLKLANNVRFEAIPGAQDSLLNTFPVAAFGFLGSNPAAIVVQGSQLTVANGTGLSLVGGDIAIEAGTLPDGSVQHSILSAPGGQITLASAAGAGEVAASTFAPSSPMLLGSIVLSQESLLDVSADAAGTIAIRGGQLVIADATLKANSENASGAPTAIDIMVSGDLIIADTRGIPAVTAMTTGTGNAGAIQVTSGNLIATTTFLDPSFLPTTLIDSHTSGEGRGGTVSIATGGLTTMGSPDGGNLFTFIDSGTTANGRGGAVTIDARTININATTITTGQLNASAFVMDLSTVNGSAGHLTMTADTIKTLDALFDTSAMFGTSPLQQGGDITITAHDISMADSQVSSINTNGGGTLTIKTDTLETDFTSFEVDTITGPGGGISIEAHIVELTNGSAMVSSSFGSGNAGDIRVTTTDHMSIVADLGTNPLATAQPSGLFSNSFGNIFGTLGGPGNAGNIIVTTPTLEMNGGRINTVTSSSGHGGDVTLNVSDTVFISGEFHTEFLKIPSVFDIGPLAPSGIVTSTIGGEFCGGMCGNAGAISINTGSLLMGSGSQINSGTASTGMGGTITISAGNAISLAGTLTDGTPVGVFSQSIGTDPSSGPGGNIALTAGQSVTISNGAAVSASSTGPGNAGSIDINAGSQFTMTDSTVTTEATQSGGGAIKITTDPSGTVQLTNSTISASVLDGTGGGGSVNIDPQYVILLNSQILAQAVQGPGGNIFITTNLLLPDANSVISASSQFGVNGTVTIQSPNAPISGQIHPLGKTPLLATSLLTQQCASVAGGQFSSFTVGGRNSVPTEPGSWLTSPIAMAGVEPRLKAEGGKADVRKAGGLKAEGERPERQTLSLRQIAPAGFLTQTFAVDRSAGCQS